MEPIFWLLRVPYVAGWLAADHASEAAARTDPIVKQVQTDRLYLRSTLSIIKMIIMTYLSDAWMKSVVA